MAKSLIKIWLTLLSKNAIIKICYKLSKIKIEKLGEIFISIFILSQLKVDF